MKEKLLEMADELTVQAENSLSHHAPTMEQAAALLRQAAQRLAELRSETIRECARVCKETAARRASRGGHYDSLVAEGAAEAVAAILALDTNAAQSSGGHKPRASDSQESPAAGHCPAAAPCAWIVTHENPAEQQYYFTSAKGWRVEVVQTNAAPVVEHADGSVTDMTAPKTTLLERLDYAIRYPASLHPTSLHMLLHDVRESLREREKNRCYICDQMTGYVCAEHAALSPGREGEKP